MGLKTDIGDAFKKLMSNGGKVELSQEQIDNVDTFAQDMTDGIKDFLTAQTWQITDLKAFVEIDELEIVEPQTADVMPTVQSIDIPYPAGSPAGAVPTPLAPNSLKDGVLMSKIKASKNAGMKTTGHAFVGSETQYPALTPEYDTNGDGEGWNQYSKVKLNMNDIVDDE